MSTYLIEGDAPSFYIFLPSARDLAWVYPLIDNFAVNMEECSVEREKNGRLTLHVALKRVYRNERCDFERALHQRLASAIDLLRIFRAEGVEIYPYFFSGDQEDESERLWYSIDLDDVASEPVALTPGQIAEAFREWRSKE